MLLLHTDGLVEHRGDDMDAAIARAAALLASAPAGRPLPILLRQLIEEVAGPAGPRGSKVSTPAWCGLGGRWPRGT